MNVQDKRLIDSLPHESQYFASKRLTQLLVEYFDTIARQTALDEMQQDEGPEFDKAMAREFTLSEKITAEARTLFERDPGAHAIRIILDTLEGFGVVPDRNTYEEETWREAFAAHAAVAGAVSTD